LVKLSHQLTEQISHFKTGDQSGGPHLVARSRAA